MAAVDLHALAIATHDIRTLIRRTPERLLWSPGRSVWGIVLCRPSRDNANAVVSIDGCLHIAMCLWPGHYVADGEYPLDGIVRMLAGTMRLGRVNGQVMVTCRLPDSISGDCCIIVSQDELPWLQPDRVTLPLEGTPVWRAPEDPRAAAHLLPLHPWLSIAGLRPSLTSAAEFFSVIGEPVEMAILPDTLRRDRLVSYWRLHVLHERERLRFAGQPKAEWLDDDGEIYRLTEAWVRGWRGPHEPLDMAPEASGGPPAADIEAPPAASPTSPSEPPMAEPAVAPPATPDVASSGWDAGDVGGFGGSWGT